MVDLNEVQVEMLASKEQHMMQLYCSRYLNNAYCFYWRSMGLCYANPPFSQLAKLGKLLNLPTYLFPLLFVLTRRMHKENDSGSRRFY